jgi:hypothetical protein
MARSSPGFIQVDFGLLDVNGRIEGRLVELQAFPSLYGFQPLLGETYRRLAAERRLGLSRRSRC